MQNYESYISDLLILHDCVIIPEFGGFICNYRSAQIDEISGKFIPPVKTILFNYKLRNNDGLLANHVAVQEKISYNEAVLHIETFVNELKTRMRTYGHIAMSEIGIFRMDAQCNIIFEPSGTNFLADTFGMLPIQVAAEKKFKTHAVDFSNQIMKYSAAAVIAVGLFVFGKNIIQAYQSPTLTQVNQSAIVAFDNQSSTSYVSPESDYVDYNPFE